MSMNIKLIMKYKSKLTIGMHRWMGIYKQMAFNEKLNKLLQETLKKKPFNYDTIFGKNSEFKKHNTLLQ
jgi:hypothetical protein